MHLFHQKMQKITCTAHHKFTDFRAKIESVKTKEQEHTYDFLQIHSRLFQTGTGRIC